MTAEPQTMTAHITPSSASGLQEPLGNIFLVEDDDAVRDSLEQLLTMQGYRTTSFRSGEEFLELASADWAGCLILDIRLSGISGMEVQAELPVRGIKLPIIVITGHGDAKNSRAAFKAGAVDFLEKPIDVDALLEAVDAAMSAGALSRRAASEYAELASRLERLTARENDVLNLILQAKHSREIAEALGISPRTVEVYKSRLMEKLQVKRTNDLLRMVISYRTTVGAVTVK